MNRHPVCEGGTTLDISGRGNRKTALRRGLSKFRSGALIKPHFWPRFKDVRTVLCSSAFSLAPPLRSTNSAAAEAALFARFSATMGRSDFSLALIVGYGLRPSRRSPGHD